MVTSDKIASDLAWLTQRLGYGLTPDEQSQLEGIRPATLLARWVDPESHGLVIPPDPFEGLSEPIPLSLKDEELANQRQMISEQYLEAWLNELLTTVDPLLEWMTFDYVYNTWVTSYSGGIEYDRLVAMEEDNTIGGDSGGPWFWINTAWGVHKGDVLMSGSSRNVWSQGRWVNNALGVSIRTS